VSDVTEIEKSNTANVNSEKRQESISTF